MRPETSKRLDARLLDAAHSRDFRLLWVGQSLSLVGTAAFSIAIAWRAFTLTGSTVALAVVLLAQSLAMLATTLLGGAVADRYDRRVVLIASDVARAAVVGLLAFTDASGALSFPLLVAFALAVGLADGFFQPAFIGLVPLVVDARSIPSANSLIGFFPPG
jgi:MFS family permease